MQFARETALTPIRKLVNANPPFAKMISLLAGLNEPGSVRRLHSQSILHYFQDFWTRCLDPCGSFFKPYRLGSASVIPENPLIALFLQQPKRFFHRQLRAERKPESYNHFRPTPGV